MQLASALGPFMMTNAAEIIRYTSAGWTPTGIKKFENMLTNVFYPRLSGEKRMSPINEILDVILCDRRYWCTVPG
jgi:hypothetical protein